MELWLQPLDVTIPFPMAWCDFPGYSTETLLAVAFHVIVAMATIFLSVRTAEERQISPLSVIVCSNFSKACIEESIPKNELTHSAQCSFQFFIKITTGRMKWALKTDQLRNVPSDNKVYVALLIWPHASTKKKQRGGYRKRRWSWEYQEMQRQTGTRKDRNLKGENETALTR